MKSEQKIAPFIETYSGIHFYFLDPTPDMVSIEDIAHALAMQVRFTGHIKRFYSVAEHSVSVSILAKNPLEGLLHDASEAYLIDIASPIKQHLPDYKKLEAGIMRVVAQKFGVSWPISADTHDADRAQLKTEARHLLRSGGKVWLKDFPTDRRQGVKPVCLPPDEAKGLFLDTFYDLTRGQYARAA